MQFIQNVKKIGNKANKWANTKVAAIVAIATASASSAFAQSSTSIDVSSVVSQLADGKDPIVAIGAGVLILLGVVAVFKFIRRAF